MIVKAKIASMIPHAGAMCLLDEVQVWDETRLTAFSLSHRAADNPLRRENKLATICGIEYAAQAMALHGRLISPGKGAPRAGYLASLRDVICYVPRLDTIDEKITIEVVRLMGEETRVIYQFVISCGTSPLLKGRAAVVLDAGA